MVFVFLPAIVFFIQLQCSIVTIIYIIVVYSKNSHNFEAGQLVLGFGERDGKIQKDISKIALGPE